jgi:hypothetical protein
VLTLLRSAGCIQRASPDKPFAAVSRYLLRSFLMPTITREWLDHIERNPTLAEFAACKPRILVKLQRPYLNRRHDARSRLDLLVAHYHFVHIHLPRDLIRDLISPHGRELALFSGRLGRCYALRLSSTDRFDREGEMLLSIECAATHRRIACLAFSVCGNWPSRQLEIGCLQGAAGIESRELTRETTRDLHGVRPKNLLLDAIYALADAWRISRIHAVSNESRIYGPDGCDTGDRAVFADYDAFWRELGGTMAAGHFVLPPALSHKGVDEVPSSRRAEYRRRKELREGIASRVCGSLATIHNEVQPQRTIDIATNAANLSTSAFAG